MRSAGVVLLVAVIVGAVVLAIVVGWLLYALCRIVWAFLFPRGMGSND